MKILVHICCAPCFTYPHRLLGEQGHDITGFFYNPNIHPYKEFRARLDALEFYAKGKNVPVIYDREYDLEEYLRGSLGCAGRGEDRCGFCYALRLEATARVACEQGFDAFTTSLLVSPYQKHDLLRSTGEELGRKNGVPFLYVDMRDGYRESRKISRDMGLYMQKYCGCIFSERDRYMRN